MQATSRIYHLRTLFEDMHAHQDIKEFTQIANHLRGATGRFLSNPEPLMQYNFFTPQLEIENDPFEFEAIFEDFKNFSYR